MIKKISPLLIIFLFIGVPSANAFFGSVLTTLTRSAKALPIDEIVRLSKLSDEVNGTKKVGKALGKLNLPKDVLEDTYMRIAIHQEKITRKQAEGMYVRLGGVHGFRGALSKVIGNNTNKTNGHLNELMIADNASSNGFRVLAIGEKYSDGLKNAPTDIDVVLEKGGKIFAIEAKYYSPTTKLPMDKYRADLDTLVQYREMHPENVVPVFSITSMPNDSRYIGMLNHEADKREVQLIFGTPSEQVEKLKMLEMIL